MNNLLKSTGKTLAKHSPAILTALGIAASLAAVVQAVAATPKALALIEQAEQEKGEKLTKTEIVKVAWKPYIPTAVTVVTEIVCIVGINAIHNRRGSAAAAAYALSSEALREYREKVVETIGEEKEHDISAAIAKEKLKKDPITDNTTIIMTGNGDSLCYDSHAGRYFNSNVEKLRHAVNELNRQILSDGYASLNDFYYEIGLDNTKLGDDIGWGVNNGLVDVSFTSMVAENGVPCLVLNYNLAPKYDYDKFR